MCNTLMCQLGYQTVTALSGVPYRDLEHHAGQPDVSDYGVLAIAGATNSSFSSAAASGMQLIKSSLRSSSTGEGYSPQAVRINMGSMLEFTPITLVFQDLR